jgi:hypothetical protein
MKDGNASFRWGDIMRTILSRVLLFVLFTAGFGSTNAWAVLTGYTSLTAFTNAVGTFSSLESSTLDFDDLAAGATIQDGDILDSIQISFDIGGLDLIVTDLYDTTSGNNCLGVNDSGQEVFFSGDGLTFSFADPVQAFSIYVIGSPNDVLAGDFSISGGGIAVLNSDTPDSVFTDGGEAYFMGIIADTPGESFSSVTLESFDPLQELLFLFNVDDVVTYTAPASQPSESSEPLPVSFAAVASAFVGLLFLMRRRLQV